MFIFGKFTVTSDTDKQLAVENELLRAQLREALASLEECHSALQAVPSNVQSRNVVKAVHKAIGVLFKHKRSGFL